MAIPESQLETWSHQGSVTQSKNTYATIKAVLEDSNAKYADRNFKVFLQGSYGNDTNTFAESDVDVVIRYDGAFFSDIRDLPANQQATYQASRRDGAYPYDVFKGHVEAILAAAFGAAAVVPPNKKAFKILESGTRRAADVLVAFEYRRFYKFNSWLDQSCAIGIGFLTSDGILIENYPKQHSDNCTRKHQNTGNNFKKLVRIFKNMRSKLVADGAIGNEIAPSYFIEGLLYNVPNPQFVGNLATQAYNILVWLHATHDRTKFLCPSEQHWLLRDGIPTCWPIANGNLFIEKVTELWNNW